MSYTANNCGDFKRLRLAEPEAVN